MARVLLVDDDAAIVGFVGEAMANAGHEMRAVLDGDEAVVVAHAEPFDAAVVDLRLEGRNGLQVIADLYGIDPALAVVLITGFMGFAVPIEAYVRARPFEFLEKPFTMAQIVAVVERALAARHTTPTPVRLSEEAFEGMVGTSAPMQRVYDQIRAYAPTRETVLILGESGTGKNVAARAIHKLSGRRGPFETINCAGIPDTLLESELFGHEAGAFTGANSRAIGWFEKAAGGTLFLDEIGDMAAGNQAKILDAVHAHEIVLVGGRQRIRVDVRLVAATNRPIDLPDCSSFRRDLYYRLSGLEIRMPALRERLQDLPVLVAHLIATVCEQLAKPVAKVSPAALGQLAAHNWPGNIRELQQVLKKARMLATGHEIGVDDVGAVLNKVAPNGRVVPPSVETLAEAVARTERATIERALAAHLHFAEAARALGVDVKTLYEKRRRHRLTDTEA